jgi:hypothetical protein
MTRKQRKRMRRRKSKPENFISKSMRKKISDWAWQIAKGMTKMPIREDQGKAYLCLICERTYCVGYDNTEGYCQGCYYLKGCLKRPEINKFKPCRECERGQR